MKVLGRNPTVELMRSQLYSADKVLVQEDINEDEKISEILSSAQNQDIRIQQVSRKELDKIAGGEPHQGVVAFTDIEPKNFSEKSLDANYGSFIYIREAQYEHNVGAIIRTAEAAGLAGVVLPPKQEITPVIVRISMGAIFHIPIYSGSLFPVIKICSKNGLDVTAIERNENATIYTGNLSNENLLIIGGEDRSISQEIANKCDQVLSIPQFGKVNSLNMSVAAGITIFELVRQQRR